MNMIVAGGAKRKDLDAAFAAGYGQRRLNGRRTWD